jgi:SAM-dependent methyltransferase
VILRKLRDFFHTLRSPRFVLADFLLAFSYFLRNPYRVAASFGVTYGETPLYTLDRLIKRCGITPDDVVYELGCGTGRTALWLAIRHRCAVVGIDCISQFIRKGRRVATLLRLRRIGLYCADICDTDYSRATCVFLSGTCMEEEDIKMLCEALTTLPEGAQILSVSYPLSAYDARFEEVEEIPATFLWGKTTVYLMRLKQPAPPAPPADPADESSPEPSELACHSSD